jgi:hypothetical protein
MVSIGPFISRMTPDLSTKTTSDESFYRDVGLYGALRKNPQYALFTHLVEKAKMVHQLATEHQGTLLVFQSSSIPAHIQKSFRDLDPHECLLIVQAHIVATNDFSGKYHVYTPLSGQKITIEATTKGLLLPDDQMTSLVKKGVYENGTLYEIGKPFV